MKVSKTVKYAIIGTAAIALSACGPIDQGYYQKPGFENQRKSAMIMRFAIRDVCRN